MEDYEMADYEMADDEMEDDEMEDYEMEDDEMEDYEMEDDETIFIMKDDKTVFRAIRQAISSIFLQTMPFSQKEKEAYSFYMDGLDAQFRGNYMLALYYYSDSLKREEDPQERAQITYNMGLIAANLECTTEVLQFNSIATYFIRSPQTLNNVGTVFFTSAEIIKSRINLSETPKIREIRKHFVKDFYAFAESYWQEAVQGAPGAYPFAENWLKTRLGNNDKDDVVNGDSFQ